MPSRHMHTQMLAHTRKVQADDVVVINGYLCNSNPQTSPPCSLRDVREPVVCLPSIIYTKTTVAGFDALHDAATRHEQQLINGGRLQCSQRQRRVSAPDRLSGADQLVEITSAGPARRGQKADRGRIIRVAKLY